MTLNRRQFNTALLTAATSVFAVPRVVFAAIQPAGDEMARRALNRLTFGARQDDITLFNEIGLEVWLDRELAKGERDDALQDRLAKGALHIEYEAGKDENGHSWKAHKAMRPYQYLDAAATELLPLVDYEKQGMHYEERERPAREVQVASLTRAVHADAQLREVMTQFWHEHFSVNALKDEHTAAYFVEHDRIMRRNALGNFRTFLGEMTRSPSMLYYLNNEASKASPANENFARELFELHTLGAESYANDKYERWSDVPRGEDGVALAYIDEDVYEAARALTGWSFGDGREITEGDHAPPIGAFHYVDAWHDPYQKRLLGVEFVPHAGPMDDGEKLLDIVAAHPGTARFVCRKIARRLFADEPPEELVQSAADIFLKAKDAQDQIAKVVRHIVLSQEFTATPPQKLKRPFEFLASLYRATGAEVVSPSLEFHWALSRCGWTQHEYRPPTGHPDQNAHWASTNYIAGMMDVATNAFEDWFGAARLDLAAQLPPDTTLVRDAAAHFSALLTGPDQAEAFGRELALAVDGDQESELASEGDDRDWQLRSIVAFAAFQPQFLYR
jgi:uncharacterized protein (DUF1800 family)